MAADSNLVPHKFGPLQDVRIVSWGTQIAQPFGAALAAEMGAEVIHVESPGRGDPYRMSGLDVAANHGKPVGSNWVQERRNMFCITLDPKEPRGRELLLRLLGRAEIWMESSPPGACDKIGLSDTEVLKSCPRLVIAHVSGFGQTAAADHLGGGDHDAIAQAFGGLTALVGPPDPSLPRAGCHQLRIT